MLIDDRKWGDIVAAARAAMDRWNASAAKHGQKDAFRFFTQKTDRYEIILTEHYDGYTRSAKALAREVATGEVRSTKVLRKKGHVVGFQPKMPDPKAWKSLADRPADEIVRKVGLLDFLILLGTGVTEVHTEGGRQ